MNNANIHSALHLLKKQVRNLDLPWLENMVNESPKKREPFKILISCILSLRTQDRTTGSASERLFKLAPDAKTMSKLSVKTIGKTIILLVFIRPRRKESGNFQRF